MYAPTEEQDGLKEKIAALKQLQAEQALQMEVTEEQPVSGVESSPARSGSARTSCATRSPSRRSNTVSTVPMIATWSGTTALVAASGFLWVRHQNDRDLLMTSLIMKRMVPSVGLSKAMNAAYNPRKKQ